MDETRREDHQFFVDIPWERKEGEPREVHLAEPNVLQIYEITRVDRGAVHFEITLERTRGGLPDRMTYSCVFLEDASLCIVNCPMPRPEEGADAAAALAIQRARNVFLTDVCICVPWAPGVSQDRNPRYAGTPEEILRLVERAEGEAAARVKRVRLNKEEQ